MIVSTNLIIEYNFKNIIIRSINNQSSIKYGLQTYLVLFNVIQLKPIIEKYAFTITIHI